MVDVPSSLTRELGTPAGIVQAYGGTAGLATGYLVESTETTPELTFPASVGVFDRMRRTDGQLGGILRALTLPIRSTGRRLSTDGIRPEVLTFLEAELGLGPYADKGRARRRRYGVSFADHLRDALLMLPLGFLPCEQVYAVGPPNPGAPGPNGPNAEVAHLRKLAPRMPRTLLEVRVGADGGLAGIVQAKPGEPANKAAGTAAGTVLIPVESLVFYVNEREGAEWTGNSVLRQAYKHWLIKDALLRLGPMVAERNGMGVPVVNYPSDGDRATALAVAKAFRAGAEAGAALPEGYTLNLVGVTGTTKDELPLVKYHDEAASKSLLAMFLDLGHDNGARSLGDTFVDYLLLSNKAVADNVAETFTEHVIRDLVELNYGPDEPYPSLIFDELGTLATPTVEALKGLVHAKLLTPGREVEVDVRRRYALPAMPEPVDDGVDDAAGSPFTEVGLPALVAAGIITAEEARQLLGLSGAAPIPPDATAPAAAVFAMLTARGAVDDAVELVTRAAAPASLLERVAALNERVLATAAG